MGNFGIKISQPSSNVFTAAPKDLSFSTQYDTLKIVKTGTITLSLPEEEIDADFEIRTETYTHNLGYIPLFQPLAKNVIYPGDLDDTDDFIINNAVEEDIPAGGYSPGTAFEVATVYATSTDLILEVNRTSAIIPITFGARDAIVYYTLFYNKLDEEFDLLS